MAYILFIRSKRWMVLIDAAKGCATLPPDLSEYPADFVVLSFYKLFGYPTGLGALLVRNGA
jgi:molybdenum cofactor sulfurtransferase